MPEWIKQKSLHANVMQMFVLPRKQHNFTIKVEFSKVSKLDDLGIEILTNIHSINSASHSLNQKLATYESGEWTQKTPCPFSLRQDIFRACKEIERHLHRHANLVMTSANFYFKVDDHDRIYLCFATCIRVDKMAMCLNGHRPIVLGLFGHE